MDTIFSKIIRREIPADIIYEDEYTIVIPDKFPSMPGQLVVITKKQISYVFDLPEKDYVALNAVTQKIAKALDKIYPGMRTCIVIEGFEVPHVHVKVYPCIAPGLVLHPHQEASSEVLKTLADNVRQALKE